MEGEESFEQFSPEVRIKDPRNRETASFLPPIKLFHGTSDYSIPSDARLECLLTQCINLVEALKGVGAEAKVILYERKSHTDLFLQMSMVPVCHPKKSRNYTMMPAKRSLKRYVSITISKGNG
ncbi:hypothetical protein V6Z12_A12G168600 [Gossypium hirsutum]